MNYVAWALAGMVGQSLLTLMVKLATRSGRVSSMLVLAVATSMVAASAIAIILFRGDLRDSGLRQLERAEVAFAIGAGIALTVAMASLFRALSLGPATVVVPLYGMFVVGGALLGVVVLGEPLTSRKVVGIALAMVAANLIAGGGEAR